MTSKDNPAVDGGTPVREKFLPFGAPCLGEEEIVEVVDTLRSHAFEAGEHILSLPLTPGMSEADLQDVIRAVYKVAAAYAKA
jgi:dTDP-4-amino-4,6-dideoxygalactose transaminase